MDATPIIIKKKKAHAHAHHGGSWKVAYADFVTAMMAFFMVMWIMGLSDDKRAQIQGYFNDPIGFAKNQSRSRTVIPLKGSPASKPGQTQHQTEPYKDDQQAVKNLKKEIDRALEASPELKKLMGHIEITITSEGLRIEFIEDSNYFFESGKAILKPAAVALIQQLGPKLAASGRPMKVEGHTDSAPYSGDPYGNFALSSARANALGDALVRAQVSINKITAVTGLADRELRDPEHPLSPKNRRVTIMLPFTTPVTATVPMPKDAVRHSMEHQVAPEFQVGPGKPDILQQKK